MQSKNIRSLFLIGPTSHAKRALLFNCAAHWAEKGRKVLYVSPTGVLQIPLEIHGADTSGILKNIKVVHVPEWQDLLKCLYSLHTHTFIAEIILVEDLKLYLQEKPQNEMHYALIFASLLDATEVCARRSEKPALLLVGIDERVFTYDKFHHMIDTFCSDAVCLIECKKLSTGSKCVMVSKIVPSAANKRRTRLEFIEDSKNGFLILKRITELIDLC